MRYIKTYEEINPWLDPSKVRIGDYVLLHTFSPIDEYVDNNIGEVIDIGNNEVGVSFSPDKPTNMKFFFDVYFKLYADRYGEKYFYRKFKKHDIKYTSQYKEDLEIMLTANKYNL